jgi:hypothetical protein
MYDTTSNKIKKDAGLNKWQWFSITRVIIHVVTAYSDHFRRPPQQVLEITTSGQVDKLHLSHSYHKEVLVLNLIPQAARKQTEA